MNINMNPNSELHQSIVNVPNLVQVRTRFRAGIPVQEAMMMYTCAIREIKTKLEGLKRRTVRAEFRNPIEMVKIPGEEALKHCGEAASGEVFP